MLTIEKIEHLEDLLEKTGQETMTVEELHGLLSAIACGPVAVKPDQWLPLVFLSEDELPKEVPEGDGHALEDRPQVSAIQPVQLHLLGDRGHVSSSSHGRLVHPPGVQQQVGKGEG